MEKWQQTEKHPQLVHKAFEAQATHRPESIALSFADKTMTYAELNRRANQLAHHLQSFGVGPETRVALCVERSFEMVVALLAILKAGGAYVPCDPTFPKDSLTFILADSGATLLLTQQVLLETLPEFAIKVVCLDTEWEVVESQSEENPESGVTVENLAYVTYTSGSSGRPKGAEIPHRSLMGFMVDVDYVQFDSDQIALQHSSILWDALTLELWPALVHGGRCVLFSGRAASPAELGAVIKREGVSVLWLTSSLFNALMETDTGAEQLSGVQQLMLGGEPLSVRHVKLGLRQLSQTTLINGYGPSECTVFACCCVIPPELDEGLQTVPIGKPIGDRKIYVLDAHMKRVPIGVTGEMYIGGPSLARGYVNQPKLTAEKFVPNPLNDRPGERLYKTGDLVRYLPDGKLDFVGRIDSQIKLRGFRIEPEEIEKALGTHPAIREAVVLMREYAPGKKRLETHLVVDLDLSPSINDLRHYLKEKLPEYMIPAAFFFVEALPLNQNGKVDRQALIASREISGNDDSSYAPPRNATEQLLTEIWSQVLGVERIGIHDNFFELGGDSIITIQIVARANEHGIHLTTKQLFHHQTISELAEVAGTKSRAAAEQGVVHGPVQLSPIQQWFFEKEVEDPHHWNQAIMLETTQALQPQLIKAAVDELLRHHDMLRACFRRDVNGWEQTITEDHWQAYARIDLAKLETDERVVVLEAATTSIQTTLNLGTGPLIRVVEIVLAENERRLLLIVHHLVVDAVSLRILLEDLITGYQQLLSGQPISLPAKTTSFPYWSAQLAAYAQSAAGFKELSYWTSEDRAGVERLAVDGAGANTVGSARSVSVTLNAEETKLLLRDVPKVYRTKITEVLMAALVLALKQWRGFDRILVNLEGHGREDLFEEVDLTRTVGWMTSIYPVVLEVRNGLGTEEVVRSVKEQLRRIPNHGIGFGILKYLSNDAKIREKFRGFPEPELSFNYLGQMDQIFGAELSKLAQEPSGRCQSERAQRDHLIDVSAQIIQGELKLHWIYSENKHKESTITELAGHYIRELRRIISLCAKGRLMYSPSDFPQAELSEAELQNLLIEIGQPV